MNQTIIKILTLGFFVSMISGFVFCRMGYFESSETASALHVITNGGELLNSNAQQDTSHETIQQASETLILPSSKSMTHPIKSEFDNKLSTEQNRQETKAEPELIQEDYKKIVSKAQKRAMEHDSISADEHAVEAEPLSEEAEENHKGIAWRTIGIGLLGIIFVSIGSIVYFKRRSK